MNAAIMMSSVHPSRTCQSCFAHDPAAGCLAGHDTPTAACLDHRTMDEDLRNVHQPHIAPGVKNAEPIAAAGGMYDQLSAVGKGRGVPANDSASADTPRSGVPPGAAQPEALSRDRALTLSTIGPRITAARELNGISQTDAAKLLGYKTPAQLSLWEMGRRVPPIYQLARASSALGVSMDFLFGLSADPERDARAARRNACVRATHAHLSQVAENIAQLIEGSDNLAGPSAAHFRDIVGAARDLTDAVTKFHRLNVAAFQEMPGGATLLAATDRMEAIELRSARVLQQHDEHAREMAARLAAIQAIEQPDHAD